jgi:hypothetical protein
MSSGGMDYSGEEYLAEKACFKNNIWSNVVLPLIALACVYIFAAK